LRNKYKLNKPKANNNYKLFVYGTLRIGEKNNKYLLNSSLIPKGIKINGYEIRKSDTYYPYAFLNTKDSIVGDLYIIDDSIFKELDVIEGIDEGIYTRHYDSENGFYIYLKAIDDRHLYKLIESGDWYTTK
jgi:gamma-glutamylcyclotransferase (GGCT)/AIG2-like uncharacterized protein YtfP